MARSWQEIREAKKAYQASKIPEDWVLSPEISPEMDKFVEFPRISGILTQKELEITEYPDATELVESIRCGKYTSEEIVRAFCKRAAIAHQLTNCLTEIMFDEALSRACFLDQHFSQTSELVGPLHGIPISVKDCFQIKGYDSTVGLCAFAFQPAGKNSTLVNMLQAAGAVIHCKTAVPQAMLALDTHSNLFGRTLNPYGRHVTAGGSSGGEGALLAMKGSALGVGTDTGGSIRIPAMCNGLYCMKPSSTALPLTGNVETGVDLPGAAALAIRPAAGPLARSLRDCKLFFSAMEALRPWEDDPNVAPCIWTRSDFSRSSENMAKIRLGVVWSDGLIEPLPPVQRLLNEVTARLETSGIGTVRMEIGHYLSRCQNLARSFFTLDGGNYMLDLLQKTGEPLSPWLAQRLKRRSPKTFHELCRMHVAKENLARDFSQCWSDDAGEIYAFVCPIAPHPAPPIDRWNSLSYTSSFAMLDLPCGTVPIRTVNQRDLEDATSTTAPLSPWDEENRKLWNEIDRSIYRGTPLGVQVVVPKMQERRLYRALAIVAGAVSGRQINARDQKL